MPALPPQNLAINAACFACLGMSQGDVMRLALWDSIAGIGSFITRAGITNQTQINAVAALYSAGIQNGWLAKCDLIYPFVGGTAQAHAQNLKSSNFTITWGIAGVSTVVHDANGITGSGVGTGVGDTGYIASSSGQISLNSAHIGAYVRTTMAAATRGIIAAQTGTEFIRLTTAAGPTAQSRTNCSTNIVAGTQLRFIVGSRLDAASQHFYTDGVDNSAANPSVAVPVANLCVLALTPSGSSPSTCTLSGATAGSGLTFAEYTLMAADWQVFQTALGRQV